MGDWEQWTHPLLSPDHLEWVKSWPQTLDWNGVYLCHATPSNNAENWLDRRGGRQLVTSPRDRVERHMAGIGASLTLCAHTHIPRMVRVGTQVVCNPGSVGCPAYLDDRCDPPFIGETGAPDARYGIFELVNGQWHTELCTVPYDPMPMVEIALSRGGGGWAEALRSGWFTPPA